MYDSFLERHVASTSERSLRNCKRGRASWIPFACMMRRCWAWEVFLEVGSWESDWQTRYAQMMCKILLFDPSRRKVDHRPIPDASWEEC